MTILEKAKELSEVGAGIQVPPNASRVLQHYGILEKFEKSGAVKSEGQQLIDWRTGKVIVQRPGDGWQRKQFGNDHYVIHRADYQTVLADEARQLGATIHLGCDVVSVDLERPSVVLSHGRLFSGDVVIGADGLRFKIPTRRPWISVRRDGIRGYGISHYCTPRTH